MQTEGVFVNGSAHFLENDKPGQSYFSALFLWTNSVLVC